MMFAAQGVMSGTQDIVLAAGIESMTRVPMGSTSMLFKKEGLGTYKSPRLEEAYPGIMFSQFMGAEMLVKKHDDQPNGMRFHLNLPGAFYLHTQLHERHGHKNLSMGLVPCVP